MAEGGQQPQSRLSDSDVVTAPPTAGKGAIDERQGHGLPLQAAGAVAVEVAANITGPKVEPSADEFASQNTQALRPPAQAPTPADDRPRPTKSRGDHLPRGLRLGDNNTNKLSSAPALEGEAVAGVEGEISASNAADGTHISLTAAASHVPLASAIDADIALPSSALAGDSTTTTTTNGLLGEQQHTNESEPTRSSPSSPPSSPSSSPASMSNPPPNRPGQQRQTMLYPSYGAPGVSPQYGYGDPSTQVPPDPFRGGPAGGSSMMPLPSMRTFEPLQPQQHAQAPLAPQPINMAGPPVPGGMMYYGAPQVQVPMPGQPYMVHDPMASRYALPPNDPRTVLSGGRTKKEIKRRTKTGCLTCRKRRIKCDEQHPVCKNCQKSKRECLGYDPIFKNQPQQPQAGLPPVSSHPAASPSIPSNGPPPTPPTSVPSNVVSLSALPLVPAGSYRSGSASSATPAARAEGLERQPTIDPSLDGVASTPRTSVSHRSVSTAESTGLFPREIDEPLHLRGGGPSFVSFYDPYPQVSPMPPHQVPMAYAENPARKMKVNELVDSIGARLPKLESPSSPETIEEIRNLYSSIYAPGLASFFETQWFTDHTTEEALLGTRPLVDSMASFLRVAKTTWPGDDNALNYTANLESRIIWDLTTFSLSFRVNEDSGLHTGGDATEARNRVTVFEALLGGDLLPHNPLVPAPPEGDHHLLREYEFWHTLAFFLCIRESPGVDLRFQRDQCLGRLRKLLDGRENRDILYSIAVIQTLAPSHTSDFDRFLPQHLDETDPRSKLAVAQKFLQEEVKVTGGMTNVVRCFAGLAVRAFINPGGNVSRLTAPAAQSSPEGDRNL